MNKPHLYLKIGMIVILAGLALGNLILFTKSMKLSDTIVQLEEDTQTLRKANISIKQDLYSQNSMENLQVIAAGLGFTKEAEPLFLKATDFASL